MNGPVGKDMARVEEQKRRMLEDVKLNAVVSDKEAVRADVSGRVRGAVEEDELVAVKRVSETARPDGSDLPPASRFRAMPVNPWVMTEQDRLSTFGLDVDTASYALCRRYIRGGFLPPAGAVRIEEFVNYSTIAIRSGASRRLRYTRKGRLRRLRGRGRIWRF